MTSSQPGNSWKIQVDLTFHRLISPSGGFTFYGRSVVCENALAACAVPLVFLNCVYYIRKFKVTFFPKEQQTLIIVPLTIKIEKKEKEEMSDRRTASKSSNFLRSYIAVGSILLFGYSICVIHYETARSYSSVGIATVLDFETNDKQELSDDTISSAAVAISDNNAESTHSAMTVVGGNTRHKNTHNDILHELDVLSGGYRSQDALKCPHPLIPFHNQIVRVNQTSTSVSEIKIPRIMHVSMKSRCLPRDLARTMDRWKATLPNYSIFFHDDEAVARLIDQDWPQFPDLHRAMRCILYKGAMKIDVWRVLILYKYGGVYTDIDNWPTDAFKESTIRSDLSGFFFQDAYGRPSQWFMAVEPHHPLMDLALNRIILNIMDMGNLRKPKVVSITGPHAMRNAYVYLLAPTCCNGTIKEQIFQNDVVLEGILEKKVLKTDPKGIIGMKHQYGDMVPYNATLNVTRAERIAMDSGVRHWEKTNHAAMKLLREILPVRYRTCRTYLEAVDSGVLKEIIPF